MNRARPGAVALAILCVAALARPALAGEAPGGQLVALNLENASIETVMKFLSELTGKAVLKHKDVQATMTLVLSRKVPSSEAVRITYEALRLQGFAVAESERTIQILPLDKAKELLLAPLGEPSAEPQAARTSMVTAVLPLQHAKADQLKSQLAPLLPKHVALAADERTNKLVATATSEEVGHLRKIVALLDVPDSADMQTRVFELKHADAAAVAEILNQLFSVAAAGVPRPGQPQQPPRPPQPGPQPGGQPGAAAPGRELTPRIAADPRTNWVIVTATPGALEDIAALILKLDTERPREIDVQVYPLKHADASSLAKQIEDLFAKGARGKALKDTVQVSAHPRGNALLALASAENHELIRKIVEAFDTAEAQEAEARTFPLKHADAEDVADQLDSLYKEEGPGYPWQSYYGVPRVERPPKVRIIGVRRTSSLVVIAPPSEFKRVEGLIQELDKEVQGEYLPPRVYQIRSTDAAELEKALNDIFEKESSRSRQSSYPFLFGRAGKEETRDISRLAGKVRFVAEKSTNRLVVIAQSAAVLQIVDELIQGLDAVDPEYVNVTVCQLKHAKAKDTADRLNELLGEAVRAQPPQQQPQQKQGEQPVPQPFYWWITGAPTKAKEEERPISPLIGRVRVVADTRTNSLMIAASAQHLPSITQLIETIDRPEPRVLIQTRLIEVTREESVRRGVRISPDAATFSAEDLDQAILGLGKFSFNKAHEHLVDGTVVTTSGTVIDARTNVNVLIQALLKNTNARLLSDPSIAVNNNEKAEIFVGADVPKITNSQQTPEGTRNDAFAYQEVGVRLVVIPHINVAGDVVLTINLMSSHIRDGEVILGGLIFDRREYTTELVVDSRQTMVMGGILTDEASTTVRKVPFLGDVPLVRYLFRKNDTVRRTTELIAFITPIVLLTAADADAATRKEMDRLDKLDEGRALKAPTPGEGAPSP